MCHLNVIKVYFKRPQIAKNITKKSRKISKNPTTLEYKTEKGVKR